VRRTLALLFTAGSLLVGCSLSRSAVGSPVDGGDGSHRDVGPMDGGADLGPPFDAGDASDVGEDMGTDVGTDMSMPVDMGTDVFTPDTGPVFPSIGGLTLVLDERGQLVIGGHLADWQDQSGSGHDFTQANALRQPTVGTVSGWAAPEFSGLQDLGGPIWSGMFGTTGGEIWIVIDNGGVTPGPDAVQEWEEDALVSTDTSGGVNVSWSTTGARGYGYTNATTHTTPRAAASTGLHLLDVAYDGSTFSVRVDGGAPQTAACASPLSNFGTVGRLGSNCDLAHGFVGRVATVIAINRVPTASEVMMMRDYLGAKYAVAH
jgi:hypothetical protein